MSQIPHFHIGTCNNRCQIQENLRKLNWIFVHTFKFSVGRKLNYVFFVFHSSKQECYTTYNMNTQSQSDEKYVGPMILYQAQTDYKRKRVQHTTNTRNCSASHSLDTMEQAHTHMKCMCVLQPSKHYRFFVVPCRTFLA